MNYIVLDLEWNQSPDGKDTEDARLPFEIIEIGAVRLNAQHEITDRFHEIIKPQVYSTLHFRIKEVVALRDADLGLARTFSEVAHDFIAWCGEDPAFCTWGPADLTELQRNLSYYKMEFPFAFPLLYYDIQKIFSIAYEDRKLRRSLEYAVSFLKLPMNIPFHSALCDAIYTAQIMKQLTEQQILENSSIDYYRTPKSRRQEVTLHYQTYTKFVSKPFESKAQAMRDRVVTSTFCEKCQRNVPKKIRWFSVGGHNYFCLAYCEKHGWLKGKIRLRQHENGSFYVIRTTKPISEEEAYEIRERKEILKLKRKLRREFHKKQQETKLET